MKVIDDGCVVVVFRVGGVEGVGHAGLDFDGDRWVRG